MNDTSTSLLASLKKNELEVLLRNAQKKSYGKNAIVIDEGDRSDSAYFINSGKVKIFLSDKNGKEIVLCILQAGEYFGEMSLIDKEERSAAAMTMEDTELTIISQRNFRDCLRTNPEIAEHIMLGLVTRLREANKKISSLALMDVNERVENLLQELAKERDGALVIDDKPTHQHIANSVGASREMISRILKNMTASGHIEVSGKQLFIRRPFR